MVLGIVCKSRALDMVVSPTGWSCARDDKLTISVDFLDSAECAATSTRDGPIYYGFVGIVITVMTGI